VADQDRVWLDVAFEGGQAVRVTVPTAIADELDRVIAAREESFVFDATDGRYTFVLRKVVFVKRSGREATVGFGAAA
jgi:hypothetical protein